MIPQNIENTFFEALRVLVFATFSLRNFGKYAKVMRWKRKIRLLQRKNTKKSYFFLHFFQESSKNLLTYPPPAI